MNQNLCLGMLSLDGQYLFERELSVNMTASVPEQHVATSHSIDISSKVLVGTENKFLVCRERVNDKFCVAGSHYHIRQSLHVSRSVDVAHNLISRVLCLESSKVLCLAAVS